MLVAQSIGQPVTGPAPAFHQPRPEWPQDLKLCQRYLTRFRQVWKFLGGGLGISDLFVFQAAAIGPAKPGCEQREAGSAKPPVQCPVSRIPQSFDHGGEQPLVPGRNSSRRSRAPLQRLPQTPEDASVTCRPVPPSEHIHCFDVDRAVPNREREYGPDHGRTVSGTVCLGWQRAARQPQHRPDSLKVLRRLVNPFIQIVIARQLKNCPVDLIEYDTTQRIGRCFVSHERKIHRGNQPEEFGRLIVYA